MHFEVNYVYCF